MGALDPLEPGDVDGELLAQMQSDIQAMLGAWVDRGVTIPAGAEVLLAAGMIRMARLGYSLAAVEDVTRVLWAQAGGRP